MGLWRRRGIVEAEGAQAARKMDRGWLALMTAFLMLLFACLALLPAYWAWRAVIHDHSFRTTALVTAIVGGFIATICLVIGMGLLDRPIKYRIPPFYMRCLLKETKRLFLVFELVTMGVAIAGGYWLAFGFKIPGK